MPTIPGIQVGVGSEDVLKQAEVLRLFPEIANRYYRPAMVRMTQELAMQILPNIPVASGALRAAFGVKVSGNGLNVKGQVGWLTPGPERRKVHLVDQDVRPHEIKSFVPWNGMNVYITIHPGHRGAGFMERGLNAAGPIIEQVGGAANEAVVNALRVGS